MVQVTMTTSYGAKGVVTKNFTGASIPAITANISNNTAVMLKDYLTLTTFGWPANEKLNYKIMVEYQALDTSVDVNSKKLGSFTKTIKSGTSTSNLYE